MFNFVYFKFEKLGKVESQLTVNYVYAGDRFFP